MPAPTVPRPGWEGYRVSMDPYRGGALDKVGMGIMTAGMGMAVPGLDTVYGIAREMFAQRPEFRTLGQYTPSMAAAGVSQNPQAMLAAGARPGAMPSRWGARVEGAPPAAGGFFANQMQQGGLLRQGAAPMGGLLGGLSRGAPTGGGLLGGGGGMSRGPTGSGAMAGGRAAQGEQRGQRNR
jgi:hypothetical protein